MIICRILALIFITHGLFPLLPVWGQESVITTVRPFRTSLVTLTAGTPQDTRQGAGVIVNADGLVVCNLHTINGAHFITAQSPLFSQRPARVLRIFPAYDLALLQTNVPASLSAVPLGSAQNLALRQTVYHIGHSYLLDGTISEGRITGLGTSKSEKRRGNRDIDIIRLNIRLYHGDSGGPLFDQNGDLIGMIVAKDTRREGVSFAIPVNKIKKILSDL